MEHRKAQHNEAPILSDSGIERRFATSGLEVRQADGGKMTIKGYALRFGSIYDMGWFTEEVAPDALRNADMQDVRVLLNHDPNQILGRTIAGTARMGVDSVGLWYEADLPDSPNGHNARVAIERGDVTQSSWGFRLRQDETGRTVGNRWEKRDGKEHRILTDVAELLDASPVTFPANPDTTVAKRCRDAEMKASAGDPIIQLEAAVIDGKALKDILSRMESRSDDSGWDTAWLFDNVAYATYRGNEMVLSLSNYIDRYNGQAKSGENADLFMELANKCQVAKDAMVAMIDGHIDALKTINASPNRGKNSAPNTKTQDEIKNTFNPALMAMEVELAELSAR